MHLEESARLAMHLEESREKTRPLAALPTATAGRSGELFPSGAPPSKKKKKRKGKEKGEKENE